MFKIDIDEKVRNASREIIKAVKDRHGELLDTIGVQLLSNALLAFDDKSRGGTGDDGIVWKPLHQDTIEAKQRRGLGRRRSRRSQRGSAGGLSGPSGSTSTLIGVDSGLMRAAALPGYRGNDRIYKINEAASEVTVGFGRSYAEYFDNLRPLLPEDIPETWEADIEEIIEDHYNSIFKEFEQ